MTRSTEPVQELAPSICAVINWQGATMYLDCYPEATSSDLEGVFRTLAAQGIEALSEEDMPVEEQEDGALRWWLAPTEVQRGGMWE